jgi:hypothetical protein
MGGMKVKRRITVDQLKELAPEQQQKLRDWWKPQTHDVIIHSFRRFGEKSIIYYPNSGNIIVNDGDGSESFVLKRDCLPLLDIGQMIELLESIDKCISITHKVDIEDWGWEVHLRHLDYYIFIQDSLCDALWQAVKVVL